MKPEDLIHAETFRDRSQTVTDGGKRKWIYVSNVKGRFSTYRKIIAYSLLAIFFVLPFIKYHGAPLFLFNFVEGKFILLGKIIWPQDFFIFAIGMISFIIFIILFTIIYGRLFCGWVCPQTIFMEFIFRPLEWLIEGSPNNQIKIDSGSKNTIDYIRKFIKHLLFFCISFIFVNFFLIYIIGIDSFIEIIQEPQSKHFVLLTVVLFFTFAFYSVYAYIREIVCTVICPYGRLQGVMFDKNTMQIAYDYVRGEPRSKLKKSAQDKPSGDCIDCKKCVIVCPTGIDIRNGVQLDCIGCTACIDACDEVMKKINLPLGLIKYSSENQIKNNTKFSFTNKLKAYSTLLIILAGFMAYLLFSMKHVDTYISRVSGQLYQEEQDSISNLYTAKIINKTNNELKVDLKLANFPGEIKLVGENEWLLKPEKVNVFTFFVRLPKSNVTQRKTPLLFDVYNSNEIIQHVKTNFLGPFK